MNIQMQPNTYVGEDVVPTGLSRATFFSLYQGEPGDYTWVADILTLEAARIAGRALAEHLGHQYIENITWEK